MKQHLRRIAIIKSVSTRTRRSLFHWTTVSSHRLTHSKRATLPEGIYFVSSILQFQLYRHLCIVSGQYEPNSTAKPLHRCDFYRSKEVGRVLKDIMKFGSSLTWNEILYRVTGESRLDGTALREFFRPLEDWLRNENLRTQEYPGWIYDGDYCKQSIETAGLFVRGGYYNVSPRSGIAPFLFIATTLLAIAGTTA